MQLFRSILFILSTSFLYTVEGCTDPEAFNCDSDTSDSHPYIYLQLSGYTDNGTPTYTAWDYSCSWSVASDGELIEENFTFTQDGECGGGLCDSGSQGDISYYNPDATDDDGSCMYYQAPSSDELEFTISPGQIHIDWSAFVSPSNATVEYYSIQRCDDSGCGWVGGGASPFMPNCSCHLTGTSVTDDYDWTDGSDVKYSFIVMYAGNSSPFMAQSDVSYIHITGGCTDESACNYDADATYNDSSCWSASSGCGCDDGEGSVSDECGVCEGDGIADGACDCDGNTLDCNGDCGGGAIDDECGVCGGNGPDNNYDCDGNCTADADCNGVCGGSDDVDVCGNCAGGIEDISECTGYGCMDETACNYNASATVDSENCTYPDDNYDCDGNCTASVDCAGGCGGSAQNDGCGICSGDNSSCSGCMDPDYEEYDESATIDDGSCATLSNEHTLMPMSFALLDSYPNPFNPLTTIRFQLPGPSDIKLDVYSLSGDKVFSNNFGVMAQGTHSYSYNAEGLASGPYFIVLSSSYGTDSQRIYLMK